MEERKGMATDASSDLPNTETKIRPDPAVSGSGSGFTPGTVLSHRYRIVAPLGRGGMGEVYRADDLRIGQQVALKFLPRTVQSDPGMVRRLVAEIRIGRQVSHPNVCRIYDIVESDGSAFITMEYIDGEDLQSLLRRIGRLPHDKAAAIGREIAAGLAAAHALGVIHRDLKPANIMIDGRGVARITDFGIAVLADEAAQRSALEGTPAYMAPEQLAGGDVTQKTDIYAFGLTLYQIFTGKRLFQATSLEALRAEHQSRQSQSLPRDAAEIDPLMQRIILRCIEEDPAERPSSMHAVIAAMPGADPLQAALDAGQTPSPEMLAASGESGEMKPAVAWPLLLVTLLLITSAYVVTARVNLLALVRLPESPEALDYRAREILARVAPGHVRRSSFHRYNFDTSDFEQRLKAAGSWKRAGMLRPTPARFFYRQSPTIMVPQGRFLALSMTDPPLNVPGMAELMLDAEGHLLRLAIVPAPGRGQSTPDAYDWSRALEAAGIELESIEPARPAMPPPVGSDLRYAWSAFYARQPSQRVRLEAATFEGKPVWFEAFPEWRPTPTTRPLPRFVGAENESNVGAVVFVLVVASAAVIARRNMVTGRTDVQAANRVAVTVLLLALASFMLHMDHAIQPQHEVELLMAGASLALWTAALGWVYYAAVEPSLRRRLPHSLIAWRRAIDGRFDDPLVGREIVIGVAAGAFVSALSSALVIVAGTGGSRPAPVPPEPSALEGPWHFLENFTAAAFTGLLLAGGCGIVFLVVHLVARRPLVTAILAAPLLAAVLLTPTPAAGGWIPIATRLFYGAAAAALIARRGFLSLAVAIFTVCLFVFVPLTLDASSWFLWRPILAMLILLALTGWGFVHAVGARRQLVPARGPWRALP